MAAKAAVHGAPLKSFSKNASDENERRHWDLEMYQRKNADVEKNNHYDFSRHELNFEIVKGEIKKLGFHEESLQLRLQKKLDEHGFKTYKDDAQNKPNCCVDWVFSGDHDRMCEMAFGKNYKSLDYTAETDNSEALKDTDIYRFLHQNEGKAKKKNKEPDILKWARDVYKFACKKWGEKNIIGMEVHLDETTPHAHILMVPIALRKARGRASTKYEKITDPSVKIKKSEYESLSDKEKEQYQKVTKASKELVSYSGVFGDNYDQRKEYMKKFHTEFFEQVGKKYGLERGDDLDLLDPEERRKRRHMRKDQLHVVQEYEHKIEELSKQQQNIENALETATKELDNKESEVVKTDSLLLQKKEELDSLESHSAILKNEIDSREERLKNLPSLEEITEREKRNNAVPSLTDIVAREKRFKANKEKLVRMLNSVRNILEEEQDYSALGELNKIGAIKNDADWFNAASMFLNSRNQKLLEEEEKRRENIKKQNGQVLILTDRLDELKKEESDISNRKKMMYESSILPVTNEKITVSVGKTRLGNMCVYAKVGDTWLNGKSVPDDILKDLTNGYCTKEQVAALFLSGDILDYLKEKTTNEIKDALINVRRKMYEGIPLPDAGDNINVSIEKIRGKNVIIAEMDGEKPRAAALSDRQVKDLKDGIATKEQMGALLLAPYIKEKLTRELDNIKTEIASKKVELSLIHIPTDADVKTAEEKLKNARQEQYSKFFLPEVKGSVIETTVSKAKNDSQHWYIWAKINNGSWMSHVLTDEQIRDLNEGVATKEQMAAKLMSENIFNNAIQYKKKELEKLNEKTWQSTLNKRSLEILGGVGEVIKKTIDVLTTWARQVRITPSTEDLNNIHTTLGLMVGVGMAKDRPEAADKLCDIAIPLASCIGPRWREAPVNIVKKVAELGAEQDAKISLDLKRGGGIKY